MQMDAVHIEERKKYTYPLKKLFTIYKIRCAGFLTMTIFLNNIIPNKCKVCTNN